ncbi:hypothetical protein LNKW23_01290 [Paralimibaculum aggregatum]|uniref:Alpha/beta hydrolase n=1 Tax=Paralimibaculum aggregatum TaxID=3036245 RepID=A0ABQ6LGW6_9RHOB|nr:hypothetical protein [Limibaculum sp. NKW23]GMG80917.1 hypothetical protein LNKW23_01290 [Limibaculum sp. NKW23]
MGRRLALAVLALGAALLAIGVLAVMPGGRVSEAPRSMMGSGFVNDWPDVAPSTWYWSDLLALRIDRPAETTVVIWNHGTQAMEDAPSCMGTAYFPPPAVIRLERIAGVRVWYLCTGADQSAGPRAHFEARAAEIAALAARLRAAGVAPERIFLAGQSGGATAAALALAAEPEGYGGAMLYAMAWQGRGEGLRRRLRRGSAHDGWVRAALAAPERFPALLVAFEADEWNGPEHLAFLAEAHPESLSLFVPGCGAGHGGAYQGCAVAAVAAKTEAWLRARLGLPAPGE